MRLIIRNAQIVNEGRIVTKDVLINKNRIEKIDHSITINKELVCNEINAEGYFDLLFTIGPLTLFDHQRTIAIDTDRLQLLGHFFLPFGFCVEYVPVHPLLSQRR